MTARKSERIEKLDAKIKQLEARRRTELTKLDQAEKKRKLAILWSWGDCIEKLLIARELDPNKLKEDLRKHLPEGTKRENAIKGIDEILEDIKTENKQKL